MGERPSSNRGPTREKYSFLPEDEAPDDALIVSEKLVAAADAAERARMWLNEHPDGDFDNMPPDGSDPRPKAASEEEIDELLAQAQAEAKASRDMIQNLELAA